ncbi:hypothetical protein Emag_001993 [Eimeria magna]
MPDVSSGYQTYACTYSVETGIAGSIRGEALRQDVATTCLKEFAAQDLLPTVGQRAVFSSSEHESSYQHESQWDPGVNTKTSTELWTPQSVAVEDRVSAGEDRVSAGDALLSHEGVSAASVPPVSVSTSPRKDERRRQVSLLSKSLAGCAIAVCLALLLLRRGKDEKATMPQVSAPQEPVIPRIGDLELPMRVREAAEHLDALLGEPAIEGLAMSIGGRVTQLEESYALLQHETSKQNTSDQRQSDSSLAEVARKRYEEGLSDLLRDANELLALTLPSIRLYSKAPALKADALRESAKATKALSAAAASYFSEVDAALVEQFAADAETSKREVSVLANLAEKSANARAADLSDAVHRLERTASFMARIGRLSWRCTKDEDLFLRWNEVATERLMNAARVDGAHLRASLDTLREQTALTNFNSDAAAVASHFSHQLKKVQEIHSRAPTTQDLVLEADPAALLMMVEELRVAEIEARENGYIALEGIKTALSHELGTKVPEADLYKDDEVTAKIFSDLAQKHAALAEGSAALMRAIIKEMPSLQANVRRQVKSARRVATLCAANAAAQAKEAREAAKKSAEASNCKEAHNQLMATRVFLENSIAASREVGQQGLKEAAWEYLDATAREAMRQVAEATKRLALKGGADSETSAKAADIQNRVCTLLDDFSAARDLSVAFGYLLELREIMKQTH